VYWGADGMAMTLRLSAAQAEALRRRARAEGASMQDVARRAVEDYIRAHEPEVPIGVVIDQELGRFARAVEQLGRWRG
jgi:predicted transcriptional regulator